MMLSCPSIVQHNAYQVKWILYEFPCIQVCMSHKCDPTKSTFFFFKNVFIRFLNLFIIIYVNVKFLNFN
jgi:hypothetical protein